MSITVKKTTATSKTLSSEIDFLSDVVADRQTKDKIKDEVGNYLVEQTLLAVADTSSPVRGERFKKLSPDYAELKRKQGSPAIPNLELRGKMLEALSFKPTANGVEIGMIDTDQAGKADGHNNFSGESRIPKRRFIPAEGQSYRSNIESEVNKIITDVIGESIPVSRSTLGSITSKAQFWSTFSEVYPEFTRNEIRGLFMRSDKLSRLLGEFGLLEFLA